LRFVTAGRVRGDASTPRLKAAHRVPFLEFQSGDRHGERLTIAEGRILVGRHPDCDIVLDVPSVSRQHCAVSVTAEAATVEDLRSRNGTLLNGVPLSTPKRLEHGDELVICGHRLTFLTEAVAPTETGSAVLADDEFDDEFDDEGSAASDAVIVSQVEVARPAAGEGLDQHAEAKLRAVLRLTRAIGASLSLDDVLPRLLDGLLEVFPQADRGFVVLPHPSSGKLRVRARRTTRPGDTGPRISRTLIDRVAASRQAILSADAVTDTRFRSNESVMVGSIRSVMCVPVISGDGRLLGVLQVDSRDLLNSFDAGDLEVLAGIAGRAAQAIEQALAHDERVEREHLNRDLELAHRVQQGLLPSRPPEIPGYEIFDFYEAARQVGGDFFGYVPLAGDRLAVVLADVSGKGVAAALLMAALSADVRYCLASEPDLGRAVSRINESFLRGGWDDRFATLIVVVLEPARDAVTICNAGHLPVFLRTPDGIVRQVAGDLGNLPLGMVAEHDFRSCTIEVPPGAGFVLCTDGVTEAMDHDGRCYGLERLETVLAGPATGAAEIGRQILADIDRHTAGVSGSDDVCLVCVRRQG
jgi:sigma-B regulation protein RsbU (phosphoserine phosphatase)